MRPPHAKGIAGEGQLRHDWLRVNNTSLEIMWERPAAGGRNSETRQSPPKKLSEERQGGRTGLKGKASGEVLHLPSTNSSQIWAVGTLPKLSYLATINECSE
ncbi:hypothetical protein Sxan_77430 [Streptomyces xanthophaeus]|uniref:Uncharacterized protein n=1 Tax=Streptomyces xanthophaeus TaxID=67385 RepID=A0A919LN75_9ACTN|nr:hypothetical protein Sxan_77430 [Streptomyces xanthophaeus]